MPVAFYLRNHPDRSYVAKWLAALLSIQYKSTGHRWIQRLDITSGSFYRKIPDSGIRIAGRDIEDLFSGLREINIMGEYMVQTKDRTSVRFGDYLKSRLKSNPRPRVCVWMPKTNSNLWHAKTLVFYGVDQNNTEKFYPNAVIVGSSNFATPAYQPHALNSNSQRPAEYEKSWNYEGDILLMNSFVLGKDKFVLNDKELVFDNIAKFPEHEVQNQIGYTDPEINVYNQINSLANELWGKSRQQEWEELKL